MLCNIDASPIYPCVYREHSRKTTAPALTAGLSLCIQGTHLYRMICLILFRFIPVHTGNTVMSCGINVLKAVYPCAYREHIHCPFSSIKRIGLSLCIQGTRLGIMICFQFISVYPCAYREHKIRGMVFKRFTGLSLCIQGTLMRKKLTQCCTRFIPVHTGNTPIITYCFIIKILTVKFLPIF